MSGLIFILIFLKTLQHESKLCGGHEQVYDLNLEIHHQGHHFTDRKGISEGCPF